ncbi:universal stress protein [Longimicrobium sp.]|uniref:universal stress protein n=1 Tax=Longimicrobium sp. TaxID=2029185 RepID=UPI002E3268CD|nr:universal stress protein [Longimicrobium sp.]HEX6039768.1 universal stress protein [Longimicrobium sp.]
MNRPIRKLVAGVATLQPDDPALAAALALSGRTGAELHLVHVDAAETIPGMAVSLSRTGALRGVVESVAPGVTGTGRVVCRALSGDPEKRLRETSAASGADLLVVGATRRGPLARAVLGTTATHLLRTMRIPMLVARGPLPERPLRVLMTTDLSHHAARAHGRGLALARALCGGAAPEMRSLYVQTPCMADGPMPLPLPPSGIGERDLLEFLDAESPGAAITPRVRGGDPASEIVHEAREWEADLLVMGTHGRRGAARVFLGSVAESVLSHAPCAVLVIPPLSAELAEVPSGSAWELAGPPAWAV